MIEFPGTPVKVPTTMKRFEKDEATDSLASHVEQVKEAPLIIVVDGQPVAALVPIEGVDMESFAVGTHPDFIELIGRSRASAAREGTTSLEDVRRELGG